jgi:hypothetical protein
LYRRYPAPEIRTLHDKSYVAFAFRTAAAAVEAFLARAIRSLGVMLAAAFFPPALPPILPPPGSLFAEELEDFRRQFPFHGDISALPALFTNAEDDQRRVYARGGRKGYMFIDHAAGACSGVSASGTSSGYCRAVEFGLTLSD